VARRLRLLHADGFLVPGAALMVDDKEVGKVTSVAFGAEGGTVGLGYVGRNVEMPGELSSEGEPVHATAVGSA
jgi:glycine cleavage system aminomethyltransferase T